MNYSHVKSNHCNGFLIDYGNRQTHNRKQPFTVETLFRQQLYLRKKAAGKCVYCRDDSTHGEKWRKFLKTIAKLKIVSHTTKVAIGSISLESKICQFNMYTPVAPTCLTSTTCVKAHQFCQFISTAFVNLTTFVNFCQLRAHQFCQQYQPLMSLQTRSQTILLSQGPTTYFTINYNKKTFGRRC